MIDDDSEDSVIDSSLVLEYTHTGFATSEWKTNNVVLATPGHYRVVIKNQHDTFRTAFRLKGSDALQRSLFNYEDVYVSSKEKFKYEFVVGNAAVRIDLQAKLKVSSASYLGIKTKYLIEIFRYEKPVKTRERRQSFPDPRRRISLLKRKNSMKKLEMTCLKDIELPFDDSDSNIVFTDNTCDDITDEEEYGSLRDAFTPRDHFETTHLIKKY